MLKNVSWKVQRSYYSPLEEQRKQCLVFPPLVPWSWIITWLYLPPCLLLCLSPCLCLCLYPCQNLLSPLSLTPWWLWSSSAVKGTDTADKEKKRGHGSSWFAHLDDLTLIMASVCRPSSSSSDSCTTVSPSSPPSSDSPPPPRRPFFTTCREYGVR